jgi:hypothetical protein
VNGSVSCPRGGVGVERELELIARSRRLSGGTWIRGREPDNFSAEWLEMTPK